MLSSDGRLRRQICVGGAGWPVLDLHRGIKVGLGSPCSLNGLHVRVRNALLGSPERPFLRECINAVDVLCRGGGRVTRSLLLCYLVIHSLKIHKVSPHPFSQSRLSSATPLSAPSVGVSALDSTLTWEERSEGPVNSKAASSCSDCLSWASGRC